MENKKLGLLLIVIGFFVGGSFIYYNSLLNEQARELRCFENEGCSQIENNFSASHVGMGIFSFILALGFYLLFFNKTEQKIIERLESEKNHAIESEKFDFALKFLNPFEKKVVKMIKEQEGITQNTLRLKADMSKAKLSYVLTELEKRNIVKRVQKGKTLAIYLKI